MKLGNDNRNLKINKLFNELSDKIRRMSKTKK